MKVPYGEFVGQPVRRGNERTRWQLVHQDCPRKGEQAVIGDSVGYLPLNQLIEAADVHWADCHQKAPLPLIPHGKFRFRREPPRFVRMPSFSSEWLLLGMAQDLVVGQEATVTKFSDASEERVLIIEELAERVVQHRADSYEGEGKTRFVLVRFEPLVEE